jgi:hypothetical protein
MTEQLPTSGELDWAMVQHQSGELDADGFAAAFRQARVMLAVVAREGDDGVQPFVIQVDGADYGVVFTATRQYEQFQPSTPFAVLTGADLLAGWPAGLGLALNPGAVPSALIDADAVRQLAAAPDRLATGTSVRVGAPDPGLPERALEVLRACVRDSPEVGAAYQLLIAAGDDPPQLVVGVQPAGPEGGVAQAFGEKVLARDPNFGGIAFTDLHGSLLATAQEYSEPLR